MAIPIVLICITVQYMLIFVLGALFYSASLYYSRFTFILCTKYGIRLAFISLKNAIRGLITAPVYRICNMYAPKTAHIWTGQDRMHIYTTEQVHIRREVRECVIESTAHKPRLVMEVLPHNGGS
jgi:hypothetical protein